MDEIIETKRHYNQHVTQLKKSDGSIEEFNTIRGGIAFPKEKTPGLILAGGILRDEEVLKVIEEKEFSTLSEAVGLVDTFYEKFLPYALYYQDLPENNAFGIILQRNSLRGSLVRPAPYAEKLDFCVPLIKDFLNDWNLKVPKESVIANQLPTDWENFSHEHEAQNGIIALFCLLSGLVHDPWNGDGFSEACLEQGLI
jgi:hypothetical protein